MSAHIWTNMGSTSGGTINEVKPGEKIALAIAEIHSVIDGLTGADGSKEEKGVGGGIIDATGVADYMVLQVKGGIAVWDYVRATA